MDIITQVTGIFADIAEWIVATIPTLTGLFYVPDTGLTFMGVLAIAGLAISIAFLLIGIVQRFLKFRG